MKGLPARKLAVEVLTTVEVDNAYANLALTSAFKRKTLAERDRAFVTALVQGVLRHRDELDADITAASSQPLKKMPAPVRNLLRMAVFQLKYMNDIPQSAVLNTAVEVGKTVGHAGIASFISGVLRGYLRKHPPVEGQGAAAADNEDDSAAALSLRFSMPLWLVTRWLEQRGLEETKGLLVYSQSVPPLTVRTCESGITVEALLNLFSSNGIQVKQGDLVPSCLIIEDRGKNKGPVDKLPGYKDGLFVVQDEPAAFASQVVAPQQGETIVDLCAAPGGKSIHLAEMMEGKGRVIAVDSHENRLEMLKQTRQRVGLTNIQTAVADGTVFDTGAPVDRVLIDAPCTGTGVINRRTDLRFKKEAPDVAALVELQRRLLRRGAQLLKPGGVLVYSTCSIEPEENQQNIDWFLAEHPQFRLDSLKPYAGEPFAAGHSAELEQGSIQLLPTRHALSGFFIARLIKALA